ncbi:hypothetical protein CCACVL1_16941 [Corchorus capsularis]|uniref:Uncharacterized protein n=1 Tax=Corchorus capsularis TaxID=210143 RepID=A0A1R3HV65_COCAP|nr:hypothetical protein CCACVL1_16941 [Corchorus capsularis]
MAILSLCCDLSVARRIWAGAAAAQQVNGKR